MRNLYLILFLLSCCCDQHPAVVQPPDGPPPTSADCAAACAHALALAPTCAEAKSPSCVGACSAVSAQPGMAHPQTACLVAAKDLAGLQACGWCK